MPHGDSPLAVLFRHRGVALPAAVLASAFDTATALWVRSPGRSASPPSLLHLQDVCRLLAQRWRTIAQPVAGRLSTLGAAIAKFDDARRELEQLQVRISCVCGVVFRFYASTSLLGSVYVSVRAGLCTVS